mmetsp:Transcript_46869/g.74856  ORF Transcript_46869/g.74856 Transcript_46869/m.74856 type:complete len:245 (-) Transcript_46869:2-736(-)
MATAIESAVSLPKLSYFKSRGRAELIRLTFAAGGVAFEDERVSRQEQRRRKEAGELPFGQFPTLTLDGKVYAQTYSIAKYAAKLAGLSASDPLDALAVESVVDAIEDVRSKFAPIRYMQITAEMKLEKYTELFDTTLPPLLSNFERILSKNTAGDGYMVGNTFTLADVAVFYMCDLLTFPSCEVQLQSVEHTRKGATCLDAFPQLQKHREKIATLPQIADWLSKRPQTPHDNILSLTDADFSML